MRVLITGGMGFIGSHVAERYLGEGCQVTVLDDLSTGSRENLASQPGLTFVQGCITEQPLVESLVSRADLVIHLAAVVGVFKVLRSPISTLRVNSEGTRIVLAAGARTKTRTLIASSSEVYGRSCAATFSETDPLFFGTEPRWAYACSKLHDEFIAQAYFLERGARVTSLRLFNTTGPRQSGEYGMVMPRFVNWALQNQPLVVYGHGAQSRCFTHVLDTVEAIYRLANSEESYGQVVNVGNDESISIHALAKRVIEETGSQSPILFQPYPIVYGNAIQDTNHRVPNLEKLEKLTGWRPQRGLREIIQSVAEQQRVCA